MYPRFIFQNTTDLSKMKKDIQQLFDEFPFEFSQAELKNEDKNNIHMDISNLTKDRFNYLKDCLGEILKGYTLSDDDPPIPVTMYFGFFSAPTKTKQLMDLLSEIQKEHRAAVENILLSHVYPKELNNIITDYSIRPKI